MIFEMMKKGVVQVEFTKKDGTNRVMNCTLSEDLIPAEFAPKGTGTVKSEDVVSVFDVDNQGWRSFNKNSVKCIRFNQG
jgi:hypothetical protein